MSAIKPRAAYCTGCGVSFEKMHLMIRHRRLDRCGGRFLPPEERSLLDKLRQLREEQVQEERRKEMSLSHFPRKGDKVNDTRRSHANGFVIRVLYNHGPEEVMVKFDDHEETYDFSEFQYSWTDSYGGVFILT